MKNEIRNEKLEMKNDEGVEEMKNEKEERIKEKGTEEIKNGNEGIHLRNPLSSAEICVPEKLPFNPYQFNRRKTAHILNIGQIEVPRVVGDIRHACGQVADLKEMGYDYNALLDKYNFADISADFVYLGKNIPPFEMPGGLKLIYDAQTWELLRENDRQFPYFSDINAFFTTKKRHNSLNFVKITKEDIPVLLAQKEAVKTCVFIADSEAYIPTYDFRRIIYALTNADLHNPILAMSRKHEDYGFYDDSYFPENVQINEESKIQLSLSADLSTLLVDGLIEGVWIEKADNLMLRTIFGCLQMSRLRITKTEYISCPSCGRTLFDLMETTARIRSRTEHLKGVKIGIMGCIVNGPGEMADADYGYVGVGTDKIALYRGKEVVMKAVKTAEAVDKLIDLIREDGRWVE